MNPPTYLYLEGRTYLQNKPRILESQHPHLTRNEQDGNSQAKLMFAQDISSLRLYVPALTNISRRSKGLARYGLRVLLMLNNLHLLLIAAG
jgi:hypothetical protein